MSTATQPSILVDDELRQLIRPLMGDEKVLLEESLVRDGCRDALVVWKEENVLLDGHNRFEICARLDIDFTIMTMSFATRDEAIVWVIQNQLGRRNLADIDRIALAAKREPLLKRRVVANLGARTELPQNSAAGSQPQEMRQLAAASAGVSHDTYTKGKKVLEQGVPELLQAVRDGDASIHAAAAVAELPPDEQVSVVANGKVTETAMKLRNRRTKNTGNNEWGTPRNYLEASRQVLGTIDVDPATHEEAQERVRR